jgi:catechol 2,3-dioxygenase-like lactoylglutathione lyase family enzyme
MASSSSTIKALYDFQNANEERNMIRVTLSLCLAALLSAGAAKAQIASPNEFGVAMGHVEFLVQDVDTTRNFFLTLGGVPAASGTAVKFPGAAGSVINHFGFQVQDLQASLDKWKAAGFKTELGSFPGQAFVYTPDGLAKIEILVNKDLTVPIVFHHIHWFVPNPGPNGGTGVMEVQAWYGKVFGAKPGKRAIFDTGDLPGVNLTFSKSDTPTAPTKGRVVDEIGFEVSDLQGFCKKESALGVKFDSSCDKGPNSPIYLTDPWGVTIELTDNLRKM